MVRPSSLSIMMPSPKKDWQAALNSSYRCAKNKASHSYEKIKTSFSSINLIGISRFFNQYCIMQYFTCKYCKHVLAMKIQKLHGAVSSLQPENRNFLDLKLVQPLLDLVECIICFENYHARSQAINEARLQNPSCPTCV